MNPTLHLILTYFLKPEIAENVLKKRYSDFHSIPKQPYGPRMKKNYYYLVLTQNLIMPKAKNLFQLFSNT